MGAFFSREIPKLGFGLMRLPKKEDGTIDLEQTSEMVDVFMDAGLVYFDTAFVYEGSEEAIGKALVQRYPRSSYTLATKLNARMIARDEASAKQEFYTSLERTGAGYFDFYLLHALQESNRKLYDDYHLWDYVRKLKGEGRIKHWGFSFHGTPELLDELLTVHPDADFVQLQINYADWDNPAVTSRGNYEVARAHDKPIVIMEPVKGGTLANPPEPVAEVLNELTPQASYASWAIRYAASLEGVLTVLSGMSTIAQMRENVSYMKDFKPLNDAQRAVIKKAQEALAAIDQVPCTGCRYCTGGCPMRIAIPDIFEALNLEMIYGRKDRAARDYANATSSHGKASSCIECRQCEAVCPQHINITERLKEASAKFEQKAES